MRRGLKWGTFGQSMRFDIRSGNMLLKYER
jgi:hypothetical protein